MQALTHRSAISETSPSYERLEYLGDAVLGLWTASTLYKKTDETEGVATLNRREQSVVNQHSLAEASRRIGLTKWVYAGTVEHLDGRTQNDRIAEELFEAMTGAIYVVSGHESAFAFLDAALGDQLIDLVNRPSVADAKSDLQSRVQQRYRELPQYRCIEGDGGGRNSHFVVELWIQNKRISAGSGHGRRAAEMMAAQAAIANLDGWPAVAKESENEPIR